MTPRDEKPKANEEPLLSKTPQDPHVNFPLPSEAKSLESLTVSRLSTVDTFRACLHPAPSAPTVLP